MLGFGSELVAPRHLTDLNPMLRPLEVVDEFLELGFDPLALFAVERLDDGLQGHRLRRHVDDGFD